MLPIARSVRERRSRRLAERGNAAPAERLFRRDQRDLVRETERDQPGGDARAAFAEHAGDPARRKRTQGLAEIGSAAGLEPDPLDRKAEIDETPRRLVRRVWPGDDEGRNVPRR